LPTGFELELVRIHQSKVPFPAQILVTSAKNYIPYTTTLFSIFT